MAGLTNRLPSAKKSKAPAASMKGQGQKNQRSTREQIVFLVVFVMFVLITMYVDRNSAVRDHAMSVPLNDGWMLETGEVVNLESLPLGNHTLEMDVGGMSVNGKALCLKSIDTNFAVYADGEQIYDYHPIIPKRMGMSYGMYVHTIAIPENSEKLSIRVEPVFSDERAGPIQNT